MEIFNDIKKLIEDSEKDVLKFYSKNNKAAGTRVRKAMQELKKLAQDLRVDISEKRK